MSKINLRNKYFVTLIIIVVFSVSINILQAVNAATSTPGSSGDPIVTKSYVDTNDKKATTQLTTLQGKYDQAIKDIASLKSQITTLNKGFVVVTIAVGKKLIAGSGTEIILRSGKATAISGTNGGLSDTTSAKDLVNGVTVSANHLLISSRDDGRGINCVTQCYLIVRGSYKLQ